MGVSGRASCNVGSDLRSELRLPNHGTDAARFEQQARV
jgi:hypothetical protein